MMAANVFLLWPCLQGAFLVMTDSIKIGSLRNSDDKDNATNQ